MLFLFCYGKIKNINKEDSKNIYYLLFVYKLNTMDAIIFENMTDEEIKEYIEEQKADDMLNSLEYQNRDFADCYL